MPPCSCVYEHGGTDSHAEARYSPTPDHPKNNLVGFRVFLPPGPLARGSVGGLSRLLMSLVSFSTCGFHTLPVVVALCRRPRFGTLSVVADS